MKEEEGGGEGGKLSARKERGREDTLPLNGFSCKVIAYVVNNDVSDTFVLFPFIH